MAWGGVSVPDFGLLHGIYLTSNQAWRHFRQRKKGEVAEPATGMLRLGLRVGVYLQVSFALVFFRADSLRSALAMVGDLFGRNGAGHVGSVLDGAFAFALFAVVWFMPNTQQILGEDPTTAAKRSSSGRACTGGRTWGGRW